MKKRIFLFGETKFAPWLFVSIMTAVITTVNAQEVIPDFYHDPGISPNRSYVNQNFNEQIDPFSGSTYPDNSLN
ncbi:MULTISPECIES: hypothetical protein [unclassified Undibacterium]|uniref:hypothetical protein n=1 Tax=unclassified Undibacterium TaxID=2630295 RepID=UPI002AC91868|nr:MULTISPECIES: hypothetical protein [unclassified Undibacterium]MEB0140497.1 hypothetical protein [Undibacterium sp. CCC2.1]MEB0174166.1 hypothetical protein [Undibacterium sp. CCC1.1]MEB0178101.1 hypothetical protein [Undibacterium sp. CCC3.4]MEB0217316.1 hypothetical protein [Undibacterium sp. 5I2]WPX44627.1 hypothetical protein RHM61_05200 [Undibacterium sp. CCC3.4]